MKKLTLLIAIVLFIQFSLFSQTCLPEGIVFTTQSQIDNFQANYPDCTEIEGLVSIDDYNGDITNLAGLNVLTSIGGYMSIMHLGTSNLSGLDNLTAIGGYLSITGGYGNLTSLTGLNNLSSIGGYLRISGQYLTNLSGLENLITIGGDFMIYNTDALTSLSGLDNITSIGGCLQIGHGTDGENNPALASISALGNLTSVGDYIIIMRNDVLPNLNGLENLTSIPGRLTIAVNPLLTSLSGLKNVTTIGEWLKIYSNDALTSLSGLENLISIADVLYIENESLTSLTGLENLTSIGAGLSIGGQIGGNPNLTSISALSNLTSIGAYLSISSNTSLTSLSGIDNIDPATITSLSIYENPLLSACEVQSVCNYLISQGADIEIYENAAGCNNKEEVMAACEYTSVSEIIKKPLFTIYPNPASREIYIYNENGVHLNGVIIYNLIGHKVLQINEINDKINISMLRQGMYIMELVSNESHYIKIIIK